MRRKGRVDGNQDTIVKALRQIPGVSVAITSGVGHGFPDLLVGYSRSGRVWTNYMFEVKDPTQPPSARALTPDEEKFKAGWRGQYAVVETLDDILIVLGLK